MLVRLRLALRACLPASLRASVCVCVWVVFVCVAALDLCFAFLCVFALPVGVHS